GQISAFGTSSKKPDAYKPGETADLGDGVSLTVATDGAYTLSGPESFKDKRGQRIFVTASVPPRFTFDNYRAVLSAEGLGRSFLNSMTVAIPSTIIPILIAAFAAYALSWMQFPGRSLLIAAVVGLLVVPLQMSLIPLLKSYNSAGQAFGFDPKSYIGIWLAHTGFGLPLAIYLLRNYMVGLPKEIMESARVDGATDFQIFTKIVLPLSFPALASFAIFQFLWTWNDLLVALVFLGPQDDKLVLTGRLVNLLGSRGGDWEILAASAFVSIAVPIFVFFALQKYLVRGLLAGSVK
ncbi:MAG: carbohydrate ABC transporter permease, partial [Paracoccaceae bacterium]